MAALSCTVSYMEASVYVGGAGLVNPEYSGVVNSSAVGCISMLVLPVLDCVCIGIVETVELAQHLKYTLPYKIGYWGILNR